MTNGETYQPGFLRTAIFSWPHLYDISILIGNYFIGSALARGLFTPMLRHDVPVSTSIVVFYYCAIPLYLAGLLMYFKPLVHCVAVAGVRKPSFSRADQAATVFTSCIFGVMAAAIVVEHTGLAAAPQPAMALALTGIFALAGGLFFFLHYRAMSVAGTGEGMDKRTYYILLVAGYLLMYPLVVGILGPVEAIRMSFDIRLDGSPPTGTVDVFLKALFRGLFVSCCAWMLIYAIRRIAGAPFGAKGRGWFFLLELTLYNTMLILIGYYGSEAPR